MKGLRILCACIIMGVLCPEYFSRSYGEGKNERKAESKIDRVMVYHDRALITRVVKLDNLLPGANDIIFPNLPELVLDDSVRAKITDGAEAKILDVEVKTVRLEKAPEVKIRQLQEKQQSLEEEKKRIQNRIKVLKLEMEYLNGARESFLESGSRIRKGQGETHLYTEGSRLKIGEYDAMLNFLKDKYAANADTQQKEEAKIREVEIQAGLVRAELVRLNAGQSSSPNKKSVKVTVDVPRAGSCQIELSYINYNISWKPGYDIRVLADEKKTEFTGYGVIKQNSGEDWTNAKISYSTAQPAVRGWLPELVPLYATVSTKLLPVSSGKSTGGIRGYANQSAVNKAVLGGEDELKDKVMAGELETETTMTESTMERKAGSVVFHVPRRADIPSDGSPHRTAISRQLFPVHFEYISVPKLSPYAYLQAIGSNNMSVPILRGDLNIFMGNDFVGSSNTDTIPPGQNFELTLSVNENIRVTRILDEKEQKKEGFLGGSQKTTYAFIIKVENYTGSDIVMNILDQIPVSETDEIEIDNVTFSHKPLKQGKNGIVKWQLNMKSRETVMINFSFTVHAPKGKEAAFFRTDLAPAVYLQKQINRNVEMEQDYHEQRRKEPAMKMMH